MQIDKKHIFVSSVEDIKEIVTPLSKYNINYFSYMRSYSDGRRIYLTNHLHNMLNYFNREYYFCGNCESHPTNYESQMVLWSTLPKQFIYQDAKEQFGINHGVFIFDKQENFTEIYGLTTIFGKKDILNFYLNNEPFLSAYFQEFKDKAKNILKRAESQMIILPFHNERLKKFKIDEADILNFNLEKQLVKLTKRQRDCAFYIVKGHSAIQMAEKLNLSPRTVETYIQQLKNKLRCHNKAELIVRLIHLLSTTN